MITEHWVNHILRDNINNDNLVCQLHQYILCNLSLQGDQEKTMDLNIMIEDEPSLDDVRAFIRKSLDIYIEQVYGVSDFEYHITAWLTTNGIYNRKSFHNHHSAFVSGVFYIGVDDESGNLIIHDPRFNANRAAPDQILDAFRPLIVEPKPGDIILFPSFIYHETEISFSHSPRVLIPFDAHDGSKPLT